MIVNYEEYFGKNEVQEYRCSPCKKNYFITELRKVGDYVHQYVTNVYYLDTLTTHTLNDDVDIYSSAMSGTILVYSSKHPECDECLQHRKQVKENKIVGWKIYPIGMKPEKNYKEKKNNWKQINEYDELRTNRNSVCDRNVGRLDAAIGSG